MENNYGLLIASIVAIVAIVGLVILFSGETTGEMTIAPNEVQCPEGYEVGHFVGVHGRMASYVCMKPAYIS